MKHWRKMSEDDIKKDGSVELSVRRKALVDPTFPNKQVNMKVVWHIVL